MTSLSTLGPSLAEDIPYVSPMKNYLAGSNPYSLFFSPVSHDEFVKIAFDCLNLTKSAGSDGLRPAIVRKVIPFISKPLIHIFNASLMQGIFPEKLKVTKVVPLFKKGDQNQFVN